MNIRHASLKRIRRLFFGQPQQGDVSSGRFDQKGQVAVILIFVIALGLIFFAATVNLSKVSFSKVLTNKAAYSAVSRLASTFASYGQALTQTYLGGNLEVCEDAVDFFDVFIWAGVAGPFAEDIIEGGGNGSTEFDWLIGWLGTYQRLAEVPRAAVDMWNRAMGAMSTSGRFVESGLQIALLNVVTDGVVIPDLWDMDIDTIFGMTGDVPNDEFSRFAYYYSQRMKQIPVPDTAALQLFLDALTELWSRGDDNWALMDPLVCATNLEHPCCRSDRYDVSTGQARLDFPAECDPCCQPPGDRPACCDYAVGYDEDGNGTPDNCGDPGSCTVRSLYYADNESSPNNYRYVYKHFFYENSLNPFFSFRELLGRDDEHHRYHVRSSEPNTHFMIPSGRQYFADNEFVLQDATRYYRQGVNTAGAPFFTYPPQVQDIGRGIFPFFYKTQNPGWGVELNTLTYTDDQCHWCDPLGDGIAQGAPASCSGSPTAPYLPPEIPRLNLGVAALGTYSGGWCVDRVNTGTYPVVLDRVAAVPASLFAAPGDCAEIAGGWKSGADRFCSPIITTGPTPGPRFPYERGCEKHGYGTACTDAGGNSVDCLCGEAGAGAAAPNLFTGYMGWPDDNLDDIIYGLPTFLNISSSLLGQGQGALTQTMPDWYPAIADWIEPSCAATPPADPCNNNTSTSAPACPEQPGCENTYTNLAREGVLRTWRRDLESFHGPIYGWVFPPAGSEYEGTSCTNSGGPVQDVWCVPPPTVTPNNYGINECAYVQPSEAATFDVNVNGTRGDLEDVVACLNWNANDVRTYVGGAPPATGNAEKFQRCGDAATCSSETCSQLPRCLVPAFYAPWPPFVDPSDLIFPLFVACRDSATVDLCSANCSQPAPLPSGPPYNLPPWDAPNLAQIAVFDATVADFFANTCTIDPFATITICDADNAGGPDLNCASTPAEVAACRCSWYNSCAGFPSPAGCGGDATYYNAVATAASALGGACAQTGPGQFIDVVRQCEAESRIQVAKMRKRYYFLNNRLQEAMSMVNPALDASGNPMGILSGAIARLTAFLDNGTPWGTPGSPNPPYTQDSPAENLIDDRIRRDTSSGGSGDLPSVVVYVWQDDLLKKPRADGSYTGYWHAAKVEARIPRRCNDSCGVGGGGDPPWPTIRSYLKGKWYNREICYSLENLYGMVKVRVIRYDEDQDPQNIFFPGGEKIWEARNYHPAAGKGLFFNLDLNCLAYVDPDIYALGDPYRNAFMLNEVPADDNNDDLPDDTPYYRCWYDVHTKMLRFGVTAEACAQYTWGGGSGGVGGQGMRVKFVPCDPGFLSGAN